MLLKESFLQEVEESFLQKAKELMVVTQILLHQELIANDPSLGEQTKGEQQPVKTTMVHHLIPIKLITKRKMIPIKRMMWLRSLLTIDNMLIWKTIMVKMQMVMIYSTRKGMKVNMETSLTGKMSTNLISIFITARSNGVNSITPGHPYKPT